MGGLSALVELSAEHSRKCSVLVHTWKTNVFYKNKQAGYFALGPWLTLVGKVAAPLWLLSTIMWRSISEIYTSNQVWFGHSLCKKCHFHWTRHSSQQGVYLILLVLCSYHVNCENRNSQGKIRAHGQAYTRWGIKISGTKLTLQKFSQAFESQNGWGWRDCLKVIQSFWRSSCPNQQNAFLPDQFSASWTRWIFYMVLDKRDELPAWLNYSLTVQFRCSGLIISFSFLLKMLSLQGHGRIWQDGRDAVSLLLHKKHPGTHLPLPSQVSRSPPEQISLVGVAQIRARQWASNGAGQVIRVWSSVSSFLPLCLVVCSQTVAEFFHSCGLYWDINRQMLL